MTRKRFALPKREDPSNRDWRKKDLYYEAESNRADCSFQVRAKSCPCLCSRPRSNREIAGDNGEDQDGERFKGGWHNSRRQNASQDNGYEKELNTSYFTSRRWHAEKQIISVKRVS